MPWLIDYLTALFILSGDGGKFILLAVFLVGLMVLLLDLRGRSAAKKKSAEEKAILKTIENVIEVVDPYGPLRNASVQYWHNRGWEGLSDNQIILQKRLLDGGLDWILGYCIVRSRKGPGFSQIKRVVAAWAGYIRDVRKLDCYRWIVELQNGRFMYLFGFFDPSGFETRTYLFVRSADTPEKAAQFEIRPKSLKRMKKDQDVYIALLDQIKSGERDWAGFKCGTDYQA